jgi:hypothetical protein
MRFAVLPERAEPLHTHPGGNMPRKLTLEPEALSIESFESGKAEEMHGTVEAYDKVPCVISGSIRFSCPASWDCREDVPAGI